MALYKITPVLLPDDNNKFIKENLTEIIKSSIDNNNINPLLNYIYYPPNNIFDEKEHLAESFQKVLNNYYLKNKIIMKPNDNKKFLEKSFNLIKNLDMSTSQIDVTSDKFKELCKTIVFIPPVDYVSGVFLLAIYYPNIKFDFSNVNDILTKKEKKELYFFGKSNYKNKLLSFFNIESTHFFNDDFIKIFQLFEYVEYEMFESVEHLQSSTRKNKAFNLFHYLKNSSNEFFFNKENISFSNPFSNPFIAMIFLKTLLILQTNEYNSVTAIHIMNTKKQYLKDKLSSILDDFCLYSDLHYSNDLIAKSILEKNLNAQKNITKEVLCEIIPSSEASLNSLTLFQILHHINKIQKIDYLFYNNINISSLRENHLNPFSLNSEFYTPLSKTQKIAFCKIYWFHISYNNASLLSESDILNFINRHLDLIKTFLNKPNLSKRNIMKIIEKSIKLASINNKYILYKNKISDSTPYELGLFLTTMQIITLFPNSDFRCFKYLGSQGSKSKKLSALLSHFIDNESPQTHEIFSFILKIRYMINIGWNQSLPLIIENISQLEKYFLNIINLTQNTNLLISKVDVFSEKLNNIIDYHLESLFKE